MAIFLAKGTKVHGHTIQKFIAGGGEGSVYAATAPSGVQVALKQNNILPGDHESRERVLRQKGLIGRHHAAVAEILEVFESDGQLYLAMEFCPGEMLRTVLERHRLLSLSQFRVLMKCCLDGLGWLHEQGIIHRDIKPENIVVTELTGSKCVGKIVDLGIALHAAKGRLTVRGMVGTPLYAAPEAFLGKDMTPDARTDLYSLGVMAFEVITGVHPYPFGDVSSLMEAICGESRPSACGIVAGIPKAVDAWLQKMMALRQDERYANARQALAVLDASFLGESPVPSPVPRPVPPRPPVPYVPVPLDGPDDDRIVPKPRPKPKPKPEPRRLEDEPLPPVKRETVPCICLNVLDGPAKGTVFVIPRQGITLGRAEVNPEDRRISIVHLRARSSGDRLRVDDFGSINGLMIGDKRKRRVTLADGERFAVGSTTLQYRREREL
jgi:serine/threonine-protein kinase